MSYRDFWKRTGDFDSLVTMIEAGYKKTREVYGVHNLTDAEIHDTSVRQAKEIAKEATDE